MYVINPNTIALQRANLGYFRTKIIELNASKTSQFSISEILKHSCNVYGSSYVGRRDFSSYVLQSNYKLPIPIYPEGGVYLLPTSSQQNPNCIWLSYYHIENYRSEGKLTALQLSNQQQMYIDVTYKQFDNQMKRTSQVIAQLIKPFYL